MLQLAEKDVLLCDDTIRICENFTGCTSPAMKKNILKSFTQSDGLVRIIVATVAFGMGLDSPNVHHIIHWRPPDDLEQYVQETGYGGRDGANAKCVLYFSPKDLGAKHHVTAGMTTYCENTVECCRVLLMRQFTEEIVGNPTHLHLCYDVCATVCTCSDCQAFDDSTDSTHVPSQTPTLSANPIIQVQLKKQLLLYRNTLFLKSSPEAALVGHEVCTGLTMKTIDTIVDRYFSIRTESDLLRIGVTSVDYCTAILCIIKKYTYS